MAKKSSFINMLVALGVICLVCSALLGVVYVMTAEPIAAANLAKTNNAIAEVVPEFDNVPSEGVFKAVVDGKEYSVYPATKGGVPVGYAVESNSIGFGGPIVVMVGFDAEGKIFNTSVVSHSETPGLGAKITDNTPGNFREQFKGMNPATANLAVTKDGGDVDAITASTISSRAFTAAVETAVKVYNSIAPAVPAVEETDGECAGETAEEGSENNE